MTFKADPGAIAGLQREPELLRFLENVAAEMSAETETRAPNWIKIRGAEFTSGVRRRVGGPEGFSEVRSPFWHLDEWGSSKNPPKPYIRPAAIKVLAARGGRLGEDG